MSPSASASCPTAASSRPASAHSPGGMREPSLFRCTGHAQDALGTRRARLHHFRWPDVAATLGRSGRASPTTSVAIYSRLIVNTAEAAIDAAIAGLGLTRVLSYQVANAMRSGALTFALKNSSLRPGPLVLFVGQRLLPLKLRAFLDFAVPRLKAELSATP